MKTAAKILLNISYIIFLSGIQNVAAQSVNIRGIITDEQAGKPLELANVTLESISGETQRGTATDKNGLYQISDVKTGQYIFQVSYIGYSSYRDTLQVNGNEQNITLSVALIAEDENLDEVEVTYRRREEDLDAGQQKIRKTDLKRVPTPAGSGDLASYLQTLPGVVATGDRGGQFFVRGGTPSENLALIDGTVIYRPFHIIGFFSVFPEEIISNVDFYAGGFGPRYSGRTSSVLDVRLRNGNYNKGRLSASMSPFVSELFVEGPLKKGKTSIMALTRGSLIEHISQSYPSGEQPLRFNSQLVKLSNRNDNGANCSALIMRTYDRGRLDFDGGDVFRWKNFVLGGRCAALSQEGSVSFFDINVGLSRAVNEVGRSENPQRYSSITRFSTDINLIQFVGSLRLDYGFFTNLRWLNHDISDLFTSTQKDHDSFITSGAYLKTSIPLGNTFQVQPGISTSFYINKFKPSFEPRLQFSWQPREKKNEELNASIGIYRQPISGISDFRDAGSAFTAWMPIPDTEKQMEAIHALLGWRQPIGKYLDFSVEGYHKWLKNVPISTWSTSFQFGTELALADGNVYGSDVRMEFNTRLFYASVGYGYSITEYETEQDLFESWFGVTSQTYNPAHDRRHQINAQTGLDYKNFTVNIGWNFGSGFPFTRPFGFDSFINYNERLPDVKDTYGEPRALIDKPFTGRMPDYHSLNISIEQAFVLPAARLSLQGGIINAYDQDNLFYYDIYTRRKIYQLPFFPYISLKMESL